MTARAFITTCAKKFRSHGCTDDGWNRVEDKNATDEACHASKFDLDNVEVKPREDIRSRGRVARLIAEKRLDDYEWACFQVFSARHEAQEGVVQSDDDDHASGSTDVVSPRRLTPLLSL
eukprot:TRINITY_DN39845_c0_g1_i1.p1 TRINITY_DN39845_c0_g1~~TRINITY_DN39845_c0_g1_i1.p1  ORF type:complete len:140 (-),score=16.29 TRINITY_DN39845_c0_g1_i1:133-489(-)